MLFLHNYYAQLFFLFWKTTGNGDAALTILLIGLAYNPATALIGAIGGIAYTLFKWIAPKKADKVLKAVGDFVKHPGEKISQAVHWVGGKVQQAKQFVGEKVSQANIWVSNKLHNASSWR